MPCALAAWASIQTPLASPMQYRCGTTSPLGARRSTRKCSSTGTAPRASRWIPAAARPRHSVRGRRPAATSTASTWREGKATPGTAEVETAHSSSVAGRRPFTPLWIRVTATPVRASTPLFWMSRRWAKRWMLLSMDGMRVGADSMTVILDPKAPYTSASSKPMYPDPTMAKRGGIQGRRSAVSLVKTVSPSITMPGGTTGSDPGAKMMSRAVTIRAPSPSTRPGGAKDTACPVGKIRACPCTTATPLVCNVRLRFSRMVLAKFWACAATSATFTTTPPLPTPPCEFTEPSVTPSPEWIWMESMKPFAWMPILAKAAVSLSA
mmetsp:Transcript_34999/g.62933  ORF Transcript_34999/g.62933 Transcript_34999/m.62933 type:complete len:322 (-) Transcript_34999:538-1503(-)